MADPRVTGVSLGGAAHQEMGGDTSAQPKVLVAVAAQGITDEKVVQEYKSQMHVLNSQNPPIANPFSPYFLKMMHSVSSGTAWPAAAFWENLADETMKDLFVN